MKIIVIILIAFFLLLIISYSIRKYNFLHRQELLKAQNESSIQNQILDWCDNLYEIKKFSKNDLFSRSKMKNGEVDLTGLNIKIKNYTEKTPWIIRK